MIVYRVAHSTDDRGPYVLPLHATYERSSLAYDLIGAHFNHRDHPIPRDEGLTYDVAHGTTDRCGFISPDALYTWFEGWLAQLDNAGYELQMFEVPENVVRKGAKQCVFNVNDATRVNTMRLVEKFDESQA